jgi:hypothetical protein
MYITGSLSIFHQNIVGYYDLLDLNIRNHKDVSRWLAQAKTPIDALKAFFGYRKHESTYFLLNHIITEV